MQLVKWISDLFPSLTRKRILSDLDDLKKELHDSTLPSYKTAVDDFGTRDLKSEFGKQFEKQFSTDFKNKYRGSCINAIHDTMINVDANIVIVKRMLEDYAGNDVVRDALSLKVSTLLQWIEAASFASRYSRRLLIAIAAAEVAKVRKEGELQGFLAPELDYLRTHQTSFINSLNILAIKAPALESTVKDLPDAVINPDNADIVEANIGIAKADPLKFGYIPILSWLPYHIGIAIAEWQVSRYKAALAEREFVEIKLLQLRQQAQGRNDPALEEKIEYTQGRLQRLTKDLEDMERRYG